METTALMLGTDKSRGYYLEMICADLENGGSDSGLARDLYGGRQRVLRRDRSARVIHDHTVSGIRDWRKFSRKIK